MNDPEECDTIGVALERARNRIEALEAALRMLIDNVETGSYESTGEAIKSARAMLDPR